MTLRQILKAYGVSRKSSEFISKVWRSETKRNYSIYLNKWLHFCFQRKTDPINPSNEEVVTFMMDYFDLYNVEYSSIKKMRTVLNWILPVNPERDQLLSLSMKSAFNLHLPIVKSKNIWDISLPLKYIQNMEETHKLDFKLLTFKTVILILLSTMCHKNVLTMLSPSAMMKYADHFSFVIQAPTKTFRADTSECTHLQQLIVHQFPMSQKLCPYATLD